MKPLEIVILIVVAVAFVAAVASIVVRKIRHKGGCDCGECGGNCACCHAKATEQKTPSERK